MNRIELAPERVLSYVSKPFGDCWRCQNCGSLQNLEVHNQRFRSRSGDDSEDNLIVLCNRCHALKHKASPLPH